MQAIMGDSIPILPGGLFTKVEGPAQQEEVVDLPTIGDWVGTEPFVDPVPLNLSERGWPEDEIPSLLVLWPDVILITEDLADVH